MQFKKEVLFEPTAKQLEFIKGVFNPQNNYCFYTGSIRSGKSYVGLALLIMFAKLYPNSRHIVIRKDLQIMKRTIIPTFSKIVPQSFIESFNMTDFICKFKNGSQIMFFAENYSTDKDLNRFRGLEFNCALLEEFNELQEATYNKVVERCGSWNIENMPPPKIICTANPTSNWIKTRFYDKHIAGELKSPYFFLIAKITDNPHLSKLYLDSLKHLPEPIYRRFVEGNWEGTDSDSQLVSWESIYNSLELFKNDDEVGEKTYYAGFDVAGHGKDKTVAIVTDDHNIIEIIELDDTSVPECVQLVKRIKIKYNIEDENITVDGAGLGAGVIDILKDENIFVYNFIGGSSQIIDNSAFKFKNLRAQCYWNLKISIESNQINNMAISDKLQSDVASINYEIDSDKQIKIESKIDLKKRIGRSPDLADALSYVNWSKVRHNIFSLPGVYVF